MISPLSALLQLFFAFQPFNLMYNEHQHKEISSGAFLCRLPYSEGFSKIKRGRILRNEMLLSKILLSIAGGIVFAALFFMSHESLKYFFYVRESVSSLHLCFGLAFLLVLFWAGFFACTL